MTGRTPECEVLWVFAQRCVDISVSPAEGDTLEASALALWEYVSSWPHAQDGMVRVDESQSLRESVVTIPMSEHLRIVEHAAERARKEAFGETLDALVRVGGVGVDERVYLSAVRDLLNLDLPPQAKVT
jgi:hypothetical protein